MVNLVQEVTRAKTLKEEVYFDKPRYGLIDIMRVERPVLVKREMLKLPAIAGEILPAEYSLYSFKRKESMIKGIETMRFTLRLTDGKDGRKDIFIEKPFSDALDVIAPSGLERKEWLVKHVKSAPGQNPASAIRCAIVTELLNRLNKELNK